MQNKVTPLKDIPETSRLVLEGQGKAIITSMEYQGLKQCYDIEVDHPDHLFVLANGIICSNSSKHTCLDEDTLVTLSDGISKKKIKDLIPFEDYVLGSDKQCNLRPVKVIQLFDQGLQDCYIWKFAVNKKETVEVISTISHKFLSREGEVDTILNINNSKDDFKTEHDVASLISHEHIGKRHCYDIMVDHPDHLFKLDCGLICSNSGMFKGKKQISGAPYIIQFLEGYESGKDKATVSEYDGKVEAIKPAAQGGSYIVINGEEHYVEPNTEIFVKKGDEVERGQIISDGLANPADITRLRGIGEGRKYVAERFKKLLDDSGAKAHRRNTEAFARGFIDKVRITNPDGLGEWLPDDIVSYNALEASYTPEEDSRYVSVKNHDAVNKYLQKPILHYTIGTKLTKSMVNHIRDTGISDKVLVSDKEPGFTSDFVRLREVATEGETDFIGRGVAPYQKANYIDAAIRGLESNLKENTNPFTRISQPDFADKIKTTGKF